MRDPQGGPVFLFSPWGEKKKEGEKRKKGDQGY
jgi:hypothetical protein